MLEKKRPGFFTLGGLIFDARRDGCPGPSSHRRAADFYSLSFVKNYWGFDDFRLKCAKLSLGRSVPRHIESNRNFIKRSHIGPFRPTCMKTSESEQIRAPWAILGSIWAPARESDLGGAYKGVKKENISNFRWDFLRLFWVQVHFLYKNVRCCWAKLFFFCFSMQSHAESNGYYVKSHF